MGQSKEIKINLTGPRNFISVSAQLLAAMAKVISGRETRHLALPPTNWHLLNNS